MALLPASPASPTKHFNAPAMHHQHNAENRSNKVEPLGRGFGDACGALDATESSIDAQPSSVRPMEAVLGPSRRNVIRLKLLNEWTPWHCDDKLESRCDAPRSESIPRPARLPAPPVGQRVEAKPSTLPACLRAVFSGQMRQQKEQEPEQPSLVPPTPRQTLRGIPRNMARRLSDVPQGVHSGRRRQTGEDRG
jgi:hypothetical protein